MLAQLTVSCGVFVVALRTHDASCRRHSSLLLYYVSLTQGQFGGQAAVIKLFHEREDGAQEAFQHELDVYKALQRSK